MSITAVTGAAGFIGSAVVRALLARGRKVRALVEPGADLANLEGSTSSRASATSPTRRASRRGLEGASSLYHLAAIYKLWAPDPEPLFRVNVEGTTAVLLAAMAARVERVVFTSSIMAVGLGGDEDKQFDLFDMAGTYTLTKYLSERIALRFARAGLPLVVVNPGMPFGPARSRADAHGQIIVRFLNAEVPVLGAGSLSVIDVDDCAEGHVLAEEKGRVGERYILTGHDVTLRDLAARNLPHRRRAGSEDRPPARDGFAHRSRDGSDRAPHGQRAARHRQGGALHVGLPALLERQSRARARPPHPAARRDAPRAPSITSALTAWSESLRQARGREQQKERG